MMKTIVWSVCFAAFSVSGTAYAEDVLWAAESAPLARALPAGELVATLAREAGLVSG